MKTDLIFDVGLHSGEDTDFYLKKGFRVVAVEANPTLIEAAKKRFATELDNGSLIIVGKAISTAQDSVRFAINSREAEWGTISTAYAQRNQSAGTSNEWIEVPSIALGSVLREHGIPYYLKIDIEGADYLCIDALKEFKDKPRFISVELTLFTFTDYFDMIANLWSLGYRKFKIINQEVLKSQVCPSPACEGNYVNYKFGKGSSGLFGNETPGEWIEVEAVLAQAKKLAKLGAQHSPTSGRLRNTLYSYYFRLFYEKILKTPIAWYDLHASF
jgi:FkbM family methyltransferase